MSHSNLEVAIHWDWMRPCVVLSGDGWTRESVFECGRCHQGVQQSGGSCVLILVYFWLDLARIEEAEGHFLVWFSQAGMRGTTKVGKISKESPGKEVEVVWYANIGELCRKKGDGNGSYLRRKRGRPNIREDGWIEWGVISERRDCGGRKCTAELDEDIHRRTSTPNKSGNTMKRRKYNYITDEYMLTKGTMTTITMTVGRMNTMMIVVKTRTMKTSLWIMNTWDDIE